MTAPKGLADAGRLAKLTLMMAALGVLPACGGQKGDGSGPGGGGGPGGGVRKFDVRVTKAEPRLLTYDVSAVGELVEEFQFRIAARVEGAADEIAFSEGDYVTTGQVLLTIDQTRYDLIVDQQAREVDERNAAVARAEAELGDATRQTSAALTTARLELELAESEFRRRQGLQDQVISAEDRKQFLIRYSQAEAAYESALLGVESVLRLARARVEEARAAAQTAEVELKLRQDDQRNATVRAPVAGTIQSRIVNPGQYVQRGSELALMVQTDPIRLRFSVPESRAAVLRKDMRAEFAVLAHPNRMFEAAIYEVGALSDPLSRQVTCWARLDNPDGLLRPGYFARVRLSIDSNNEALVLPLASVLPTEHGTVCYVVQDGIAVRRRVTTGVQVTGDAIEILSGIEPGELVVTEGAMSLQENVQVNVLAAADEREKNGNSAGTTGTILGGE